MLRTFFKYNEKMEKNIKLNTEKQFSIFKCD